MSIEYLIVSKPKLFNIPELGPRCARPNADDGGRAAAVEARVAGNYSSKCCVIFTSVSGNLLE